MTASQDQYLGCILGLALGDSGGAPYEGGVLEHLLWRLIGRDKEGQPRWTDDTQMSLDIAYSLLALGALDQEDLAQRFANSYRWSRGYGPSAARLLKRIRRGQSWQSASRAIYQHGSFGNGGAMRAAMLALFFPNDIKRLEHETRRATEITHAHPLGIEGAICIALSAHILLQRGSIEQVLQTLSNACSLPEFKTQLEILKELLVRPAPAQTVVKKLGNGITAHRSCMTAIYIALRHLDASFAELMAFAISCKGDVDTISAMAGSLWGAYNGAQSIAMLPVEQRAELEQVAKRMFAHAEKQLMN